MEGKFYPIGIRPWNIRGLVYQDKSETIQFDVSGTYSCEYDINKFPSINEK